MKVNLKKNFLLLMEDLILIFFIKSILIPSTFMTENIMTFVSLTKLGIGEQK